MAQPKCPFCLGKHDFKKSRLCPNIRQENDPSKQEEVPELYISQYSKVPPLWLATVGFSKHGKTSYLAALTMMLEHVDRVWYSTTYQYLDQYTLETIQEMRQQAMTGVQPDKTDKDKAPRPMLIHTYDVPDAGSNCLVLYDTAGEFYNKLQGPEDEGYIRSLKAAKNIWFLISLKDLEEKPDQLNKRINRLNDLLNIYLSGMQRLGVSLTGRNLIAVYTKADTIVTDIQFNFPDRVVEYLQDDPFQNLTNYALDIPDMSDFSLSSYVKEMEEISVVLEDYTRRRIPGGGAFISLARRYEMGLFFSITSALGANPVKGRLQQDATRYRVLDPYLWALHLNKPESTQPIKLVLDASVESIAIYKHTINDLAEELGTLGEVTTYYLGQTRKVSASGQAPPSAPPKKNPRPRLIGPILERSDSKALVIVLTTGPIYDLGDYARSGWRNRLLFVAVGEEQHQNWPNMTIVRQNDDIKEIVSNEFRPLFKAQQTN